MPSRTDKFIELNGNQYAPHDLRLQVNNRDRSGNGVDDLWQDYSSVRDQSDANYAAHIAANGSKVNAYDFIAADNFRIVGEIPAEITAIEELANLETEYEKTLITRVAIICDSCDDAFGISVEPIPSVYGSLIRCTNEKCGAIIQLEADNCIVKAGKFTPLEGDYS